MRGMLAAWGLEGARITFVAERENRIFNVSHHGRAFALRQHRKGLRTRSQIEAELTWMRQLSAAGLPVPQPLEPLVQEHEGQCFSLITWLDGRPLKSDRAPVFEALGKLSQRMHAQPSPELDRPHWTAEELLGDAPLWGRFWEHEALTNAEEDMLHAFRRGAREALDQADLPVRLIHADMLQENVLVNGDQVSLIDFDDCAYSYPLFDLTAPLVQRLPDPNFAEIREGLLAGYGAVDRPVLALLFAIRCCTYLGWVRDKRTTPDGEAMSERIRTRALKQAELWMSGKSPIYDS